MSSFTAVVHKEEDMYVAECREVGTVSQGGTLEEAVNNLKEATELYLEEFPIEEKERSFITFESFVFGTYKSQILCNKFGFPSIVE